jgi:hypothetical protein
MLAIMHAREEMGNTGVYIQSENFGKCFVHIDISALITLGFLNFFKTSHFFIFKNYVIKYVDRFIHEECTQKSPVKKYFIF